MLAGWLDDCECFADDLDIVVGVVFTIVGDSVDADDSFDRNIVPYCVLELSVLFLPSINSAQCRGQQGCGTSNFDEYVRDWS